MSPPDQKEGKHFEVSRTLRSWYPAAKAPGVEGREGIKARVAELQPELNAWQRRFARVMAASRITNVARAIVVPHPTGTFEDHLLLCKLGLVDFAMDDLADGELGALQDDSLREVYERYARTARSPDDLDWTGSDEASLLGSAIQEVARALHQKPGAVRFLPLWQEHFRRFCAAHIAEREHARQYQERKTLPSLKRYLTVGQWSSGAPMYFSAVLVVQSPLYEQREPLQDPLITRAFMRLGRLIRWFNDVRSLERELAEGKLINGLSLLMKSGKSETDAEKLAVARGDRNLELLRQTVQQLPPALRTWGGMMVTLAQMSRTIYMRREYHGEGGR